MSGGDDFSWFDDLFGDDSGPEQLSGPVDNASDTGPADPVQIPTGDTPSSSGSFLDTLKSAGTYIADVGKTAAQIATTRSRVDIAKTQAQSAADVARLQAQRAAGSPAVASSSSSPAP